MTAFDLNRFLLTTNSANFYGDASGSERIYIHASQDGATSSFSMLLPVENWGFPGTEIVLGAQFNHIKAFWFTAESGVGFGIDNVFIDEQGPADVPEPGTLGLLALALAGLWAGIGITNLRRTWHAAAAALLLRRRSARNTSTTSPSRGRQSGGYGQKKASPKARFSVQTQTD
ncbi:PEP-CTERM sorting domain-containing protein [Massilia sp. H-1]|nr:PEP-CTERM sorting domain-containing protein [Massilia sp. H-1]